MSLQGETPTRRDRGRRYRLPVDLDVRRAGRGDLEHVRRLLEDVSAWLHARGIEQWPARWPDEMLVPALVAGETWLLEDVSGIAGTVRGVRPRAPRLLGWQRAGDLEIGVVSLVPSRSEVAVEVGIGRDRGHVTPFAVERLEDDRRR